MRGERRVRRIGVFSSHTNFCSCQASWQGTNKWSNTTDEPPTNLRNEDLATIVCRCRFELFELFLKSLVVRFPLQPIRESAFRTLHILQLPRQFESLRVDKCKETSLVAGGPVCKNEQRFRQVQMMLRFVAALIAQRPLAQEQMGHRMIGIVGIGLLQIRPRARSLKLAMIVFRQPRRHESTLRYFHNLAGTVANVLVGQQAERCGFAVAMTLGTVLKHNRSYVSAKGSRLANSARFRKLAFVAVATGQDSQSHPQPNITT